MLLLDLPNELLDRLANTLESEQDINVVAQTNHLLHAIFNRHLYRYNIQHNGSSALFWAAAHGRDSTIRLLLKYGVDINASDGAKATALHAAVRNRRLSVMELLLSLPGIIPDREDDTGHTPLSWASCNGYVEEVKILLACRQLDVNSKRRKGITPLADALGNDQEAVVEVLLAEENIDVNSINNYGCTPLHIAINSGSKALVKLLLSTGRVELNSKDHDGCTPLLIAIQELRSAWDNGPMDEATRYHDITKLLLSQDGLDIDWNEFLMTSLLWLSAQDGYTEIVELLLAMEGVPYDEIGASGRTLLSWVASSGKDAVVKLLLDKGAKADSRDLDGRTPLSWAAEAWYHDVVRVLLEAGAEVESKDKNGDTPLRFALRHSAEGVAKVLIAHGAAIPTFSPEILERILFNALDYNTPGIIEVLLSEDMDPNVLKQISCQRLFLAAVQAGQELLTRTLLNESDINVNLKDENGDTPLHEATTRCRLSSIELLLKDPRIEVNSKNHAGDTPLSVAASNLLFDWASDGELEPSIDALESTVKLLLAHPLTVIELGDKDIWDLLLEAARRGNTGIAELMITKSRIDPTLRDDGGRTPLSLAAENGHLAMIQLLVEKGSLDPLVVDEDGATPLSWARKNGNTAIVELLSRLEYLSI
ncbi:hypothetical protein FQN50_008128 [Emmonsiellopsis sp. PD_5]|nr:hypothetical protein FQN50_008128 [Emmonsiellopsis sp. PD_5]